MVTEHATGVEELIRDRTVVITGGGGSIGSELARQVFAIGPRRLLLVDRAETPLYLVERELESKRRRKLGSGEVHVHLANVASRAEMRRFIGRERPDVIIHTAAYKHVPLMEDHPSDAVIWNIGGTMVMLDAAVDARVEHFVFVSTDKAVRPSSVMGATKRIAELLVAETAMRTGRSYVSVRFGNVLGSNGSVVPILREQLENGEPLSITHADMTRFFMTIPEAAWLILDAAALSRGADLFVLDMGEPLRVLDLARDLVRLAGRDPDSHPIDLIGLRPGEKLHEELFYDAELVERTASSKVLRAHTTPPPATVREDAIAMLLMATGADEPELREAVLDYTRGLEERSTDLDEGEEAGRAGDDASELVLSVSVSPADPEPSARAPAPVRDLAYPELKVLHDPRAAPAGDNARVRARVRAHASERAGGASRSSPRATAGRSSPTTIIRPAEWVTASVHWSSTGVRGTAFRARRPRAGRRRNR